MSIDAANPPRVIVYLTPGAGTTPIDITAFLSQQNAPTLTTTIENPIETNSFTASDVTLQGYDPAGYVRGLLAGILPGSVDYGISIYLGLWNGVSYAYDYSADGFIAPSTVQFNPKDTSFSFTVIGASRGLQTTDASTLFQRPGYFPGKWFLAAPTSRMDPATLTIAAAGSPLGCDLVLNDVIQLGTAEKFTIRSIVPDPSSSPPAFWTVGLTAGMEKDYGSGVPITLLTPYQRNIPLQTAVGTLFAAAGFPNPQFYYSAPLPNLATLFATPVNTTGLPSGNVSALAGQVVGVGVQALVAASTPSGTYYATSPTSGFSLLVPPLGATTLPIVDATLAQSTYLNSGPLRTWTRTSTPRYGLDVTMRFYGYDMTAGIRYIYTVVYLGNVPTPTFAFTTKLEREIWDPGILAWVGTTLEWAGVSSTTDEDFSLLYDSIGIAVDPASGSVLFTDVDVVSAGGPATLNTSSYERGGAGLVRNRAPNMNGPTLFIRAGVVAIVQNDGYLGLAPTINVYSVTSAGVMTSTTYNVPVSPFLVGRSLKHNYGDGNFYALQSDPENGVYLTSWTGDETFRNKSVADSFILPAAPASTARPPVDLICQSTVGGALSGVYPMYALIGGTVLYVSNQQTGVVPYLDMTGLSVADALGQLSILVAGIFYLSQNGNRWTFRSRSFPMPGNTIGTNDQIDGDAGFLTLTTQGVFNRWAGYVSITNENDATIFGFAGNAAYASATQTAFGQGGLALELKCRFVSSSSFATALATSLLNYLGTQKRYIELERLRDGRAYEVGRTFHAIVDGASRNFQIIETGHPVVGVTVKVVGLEV